MKSVYPFFVGLLLLTSVLITVSCVKEKTPTRVPEETEKMIQFNVISPTPDSTYSYMEEIFLTFTLSGEMELHGYEMELVNMATGNIEFESSDHIHMGEISVDESWVNELSQPAQMHLILRGITGHDGSFEQHDVYFNCESDN